MSNHCRVARWPPWALALAALWFAACAVADVARQPTDDSGAGMTCREFLAAAQQAWERPGGDWVDAVDRPHGTQPFDTAHVTRSKAAQVVQWNATALVAHWQKAGAWPGAIHLRSLGGAKGAVSFASREGADATQRPQLHLTWSDGRESELPPVADAHLPCPNFRNAGREPQIKIAEGVNAFLLFDLPQRAGHRVTKASLTLISLRQSGGGASVGMYAGRRPGGMPGAMQSGLAAQYPQDRGLDRDPGVWLVDRFESPAVTRKWLSDSDAERVKFARRSEDAKRFEPLDATALAVTLPKGGSQALNSHLRFSSLDSEEPGEAYFRYYLRLADNWDPTVDGGKLPGLSGTYGRAGWGGRKPDGMNGWSARGSFLRQAPEGSPLEELRAVGFYVYHAAMTDRYGDTWRWNLAPAGLLQKNRWYCIEQHVRLNTPGQTDGVLQAWVDGRLVFNKTDMRYRDTDALRIESVWMNVYHGGTQRAPQDMTLFIDNLVIARRYIGPMGIPPQRP
jgi:hypothetical protein